MFRDRGGDVLYVGKANSIRKRVGSHFSGKSNREMVRRIHDIEVLVTQTEAEALIAEQSFIKRYRPKFNIRLRDDKSYPYVAISLDEDFPRVYFTRERHKPNRAYFGPFSSAKRVRETLDLLGKLFQYRTCEGPEPGRRSGVPCLDHFIKRCQAPCVGYIDQEEYRRNIDQIVGFLSGRYKQVTSDLVAKMDEASAAQDFERAALFRDRLNAVQSLMERQRVAGGSLGSADLIGVVVEGTDANAQVFQVRDGVLAERQGFYLAGGEEREVGEVAESFLLQYYGAAPAVPARVVVGPELKDRTEVLAGGAVDAARREGRGPRRGPRRLSPPARAGRAQRAARPGPGPAAPRAPPPAAGRGAERAPGRAGARAAAGPDRGVRHLEPGRDPPGRLDGRLRGRRAEEVRLPQVQDPRGLQVRPENGEGTAAARTTSPRCGRC